MDRAESRNGAGSQYWLKIEENGSQSLTRRDGSPVLGSAPSGEATFELDWAARSNDFLFTDLNAAGEDSTADIIAYETLPNLLYPHAGGIGSVAFAQLPIHLVGHSRGASVVTELARMLGERGIWVDQVTLLDARPLLDSDFSVGPSEVDPYPQVYSNVIFGDGYWRADGFGSGDFDAFPIDGTHSVQLDHTLIGHNDVHLWYHGTIDTSPDATNGEYAVPEAWYEGSMGPRDATGYHYSRIGGGDRPSDGLAPRFGGSASRVAIGSFDRLGPQWPNAADVRLSQHAVSSLSELRGTFLYGDYDSSLTATLILDRNQNPYDQDAVASIALGSRAATGDQVGDWEFSVTPGSVAPGTYYVAIKVTDGINTRYSYAPSAITVTPPSGSEVLVASFFERAPTGIADGDWAKAELLSQVPTAAYGLADWGAENYWFQTPDGDVWTMWHGGAVHALENGQHKWVLTNLAEAGGLTETLRFEPGSLSGVVTGWRAFSIQGVMDGALFSLWWSPASSAGTYLDRDGTTHQGSASGLRENGWVLSSISNALINPSTGGSATHPNFKAFTESQASGRTSFRPGEATGNPVNDGISVVLVSADRQVWVVSFSVRQREIPGTRTDLNGQWLIEPIASVPSVNDLGYSPALPGLLTRYWDLAGV